MPEFKSQRRPHEVFLADPGTAKPGLYTDGDPPTVTAPPAAWTELNPNAAATADGFTIGSEIEYEDEEPSIDEVHSPATDPVSASAMIEFTIHKPTPAEIAAVLNKTPTEITPAGAMVHGVETYKGEREKTTTYKALLYRYRNILVPGQGVVVDQYWCPLVVLMPSFSLQGQKAGTPPQLTVTIKVYKHPTLGVYDHDYVSAYYTG